MTAAPTDFKKYLLTEFQCASLRLRLAQSDVDAISLALANGLVTPDQALALAADVDVLRVVGSPPEAAA